MSSYLPSFVPPDLAERLNKIYARAKEIGLSDCPSIEHLEENAIARSRQKESNIVFPDKCASQDEVEAFYANLTDEDWEYLDSLYPAFCNSKEEYDWKHEQILAKVRSFSEEDYNNLRRRLILSCKTKEQCEMEDKELSRLLKQNAKIFGRSESKSGISGDRFPGSSSTFGMGGSRFSGSATAPGIGGSRFAGSAIHAGIGGLDFLGSAPYDSGGGDSPRSAYNFSGRDIPGYTHESALPYDSSGSHWGDHFAGSAFPSDYSGGHYIESGSTSNFYGSNFDGGQFAGSALPSDYIGGQYLESGSKSNFDGSNFDGGRFSGSEPIRDFSASFFPEPESGIGGGYDHYLESGSTSNFSGDHFSRSASIHDFGASLFQGPTSGIGGGHDHFQESRSTSNFSESVFPESASTLDYENDHSMKKMKNIKIGKLTKSFSRKMLGS